MKQTLDIIDRLYSEAKLDKEELLFLINNRDDEATEHIKSKARDKCNEIYGNKVYIRGLIEFTNHCKNDCLYCGIRRSNKSVYRYRLDIDDIINCCEAGCALGFRTFVLQGGEDVYFGDDILCSIVNKIKTKFPHCAVTLSCGERSYDSYKRLYEAGADRYLLRHETINKSHYEKLHPSKMSYDNRLECLHALKDIGYQTGCGFMVGSPYQTIENIVEDLLFIKEFSPHMVGIGPFISHKETPFAAFPSGTPELTLFLLSIIRLLLPEVLLPATTALGTISDNGRENGILHGANVIMPNLSPADVRRHYSLYDNKASFGCEAAEGLKELKKRISDIGYEIVTDRGDSKIKTK